MKIREIVDDNKYILEIEGKQYNLSSLPKEAKIERELVNEGKLPLLIALISTGVLKVVNTSNLNGAVTLEKTIEERLISLSKDLVTETGNILSSIQETRELFRVQYSEILQDKNDVVSRNNYISNKINDLGNLYTEIQAIVAMLDLNLTNTHETLREHIKCAIVAEEQVNNKLSDFLEVEKSVATRLTSTANALYENNQSIKSLEKNFERFNTMLDSYNRETRAKDCLSRLTSIIYNRLNMYKDLRDNTTDHEKEIYAKLLTELTYLQGEMRQ